MSIFIRQKEDKPYDQYRVYFYCQPAQLLVVGSITHKFSISHISKIDIRYVREKILEDDFGKTIVAIPKNEMARFKRFMAFFLGNIEYNITIGDVNQKRTVVIEDLIKYIKEHMGYDTIRMAKAKENLIDIESGVDYRVVDQNAFVLMVEDQKGNEKQVHRDDFGHVFFHLCKY